MSLSARLAAAIGPHQATLELGWMRDAARAAPAGASLQKMVARRCVGEPLQYILGTQPFGPLNILVRKPVLIPRPETEHWVLRLADAITPSPRKPIKLLDLGTGSGCIPLLLCHLWAPGCLRAHGIDSSPHAVQLAVENARECGFSGAEHKHNAFSATLANFLPPSFPDDHLSPPFDVITSNPPYIPWNEYLYLPHSVSCYEDRKALFGGPDGLEFYRAIARIVSRQGMTTPGALVALEVGHRQAAAVANLMLTTGRARGTDIWKDPWGKERTVIAHM